MPLHTCAPPVQTEPKAQSLWTCPQCGAVWEAAPERSGIFDFDRGDVVSRAAWIRVEAGSLLAG
ncbi:MAG: hypothetical protein E6G52_01745 [Actinobacteria bacterium]|nr:MAG: hypothetical protein E6G61_04205 [Actinomycetota bacterium]TMK67897.1 MAG: hypothetical protein E6G52_01745 [Actinomycetota bacterium]